MGFAIAFYLLIFPASILALLALLIYSAVATYRAPEVGLRRYLLPRVVISSVLALIPPVLAEALVFSGYRGFVSALFVEIGAWCLATATVWATSLGVRASRVKRFRG